MHCEIIGVSDRYADQFIDDIKIEI